MLYSSWVMLMQISRLFEIVYLLMNKKTVTAKELAERFEVSTRTIYRDIDTLSASGIPIYTNKGKGGGISLLDHFVLNKSVLSESEQHDILSSLQSMEALQPMQFSPVLSKLSALFNFESTAWIEADLSDWSTQQKDLFEHLKQAILEKHIIEFDYHGTGGHTSSRRVEPLQLWFKHRSWYLKSFCLEKNDYRLFKLNRLKHFKVTSESFDRLLDSTYNFESSPARIEQEIVIKLLMDANQAYRIYDDFESSQIEELPDGRFLVTLQYPEDEWVYSFILSFGCAVEVIEPTHLRKIIMQRLKKAHEKYSQA